MTAGKDIWLDLSELAQNDQGLLGEAVREAMTNREHISLRDLEREILSRADPALRAVISAVEDFARAANHTGKLSELPYLEQVYALARQDNSLPQKIFNDAATWLRDRGASLEKAILFSVLRYQELPRQELN